MKKRTLLITILISVVIIGIVTAIVLIPNNPITKLLEDVGILEPDAPECMHSFGQYNLVGRPTFDTPATLESTCKLCQTKKTQSVYAADQLTYEVDDEGLTHITGAENYNGNVLYLSATKKDGSTVHVVDDSVFCEKDFEFIFVEEGIQQIDNYAFAFNKSLKEVHLPASVTAYGSYTFAGCSALESVVFAPGATKLGVQQFYECRSLTNVVLPSKIEDLPLGLFFGCKSLAEIELPSSLVNIGAEAFASCEKLASIKLPETLKEIYPNSFAGCTSLTTVTLPALDKLHFNAFLGCTGLKTVFLSGGIRTIEVNGSDGPFFYCSSDLVLYTDATEQPSGWATHFENYNSNVADEDGGELNDDAYHNLKVVYGCSLADFPG